MFEQTINISCPSTVYIAMYVGVEARLKTADQFKNETSGIKQVIIYNNKKTASFGLSHSLSEVRPCPIMTDDFLQSISHRVGETLAQVRRDALPSAQDTLPELVGGHTDTVEFRCQCRRHDPHTFSANREIT